MQQVKKLNIATFIFILFLLFSGGKAWAKVHTVQPGESLYSIGKNMGIPPEKIVSTNALNSNSIVTGQVLLIPEKYIVVSGDTLYSISSKFGVEIWEIQSLNGLSSDKIYPGQTLLIPQKSPYTKITVQKGDTLSSICQYRGVKMEDVKTLNGLTYDVIYAGSQLLLPQPSTTGRSQGNLASRGYIDRSSYVKSSSGIYYTAEDRMLLAKLIHAEAEGEPYKGKVAVGATVVNRVKDSSFPNTIKDVIYQVDSKGYYQFCPVREGRIYSITANADSLAASDEALSGIDPTGGSLYFYNPKKTSNTWLKKKPIYIQIGNHIFTK